MGRPRKKKSPSPPISRNRPLYDPDSDVSQSDNEIARLSPTSKQQQQQQQAQQQTNSQQMEVVDAEVPISKDDPNYDFEVEKILACDVEKVSGRVIYMVKWKGYSEEDNTEEPIEQLTGCYNTLKSTLLKEQGHVAFQLDKVNRKSAQNFAKKLTEANLKGSDNVPDWNEDLWSSVEPSTEPQVLAFFENKKEVAVRFDNNHINIVNLKHFLAETDVTGRKAMLDFAESLAFQF